MKKLFLQKLRNRPGQGLLETVVAFSILITGAVSLLVLVVASSTARGLAENQTVASNFAREGIEVVRNVRDTNWLEGDAFDDGLTAPVNDYTFAPRFDPTTNLWSLIPDPDAISDVAGVVYRFDSGPHAGVFTQTDSGLPAGAVATPYRRLLTLDEICESGAFAVSGTSCAGMSELKIGIRVVSDVEWVERGRTHRVSIEERIYDWH